MSRILVSGLINIETTLKVDGFPLPYFPVCYPFHGVRTSVSGVGYNIAKALTTLGDDVDLLSIIGQDIPADQVRSALALEGIVDSNVLGLMEETAQSVILYDPDGRRQIHADLKTIQDQVYPIKNFERLIGEPDLAILSNTNFSRPLLDVARAHGVTIAADVHAIAELDDQYNRDFMAAADILFMSHESLPISPDAWVNQVRNTFDPKILVIGLGSDGALLSVRGEDEPEHIPAVRVRPIINTIGAGDALFSAFIHCYLTSNDPYQAIRRAVVFASYKIGAQGAADGFLNQDDLEKIYHETQSP
ncbi:MAG: carbohydrate kinase family protein [Chloroflexota bacterium]